jgi:O-methyltransferase
MSWVNLKDEDIYGNIKGKYTMVKPVRFYNLMRCCKHVVEKGIFGDFVECGVWRGGLCAAMAIVAARESRGRRVVAFDSFQGLPEPETVDGSKALPWTGGCRAEEAYLDKVMALAVPGRDYVKYPGWFEDTIPGYDSPIAILRLDADWYKSTKICLDHLYDKVVVGGYVIIDDYGTWPGCKKAVDEFRDARGIQSPLLRNSDVMDGERHWLKE